MPNGDIANNGTDGGNWRIWPIIKDNGVTPTILIKDGPGCLNLQNFNTYSGGTIVNNGILCAGGVDTPSPALTMASLGTGIVKVNGSSILEMGFGTANANIDYFVTNSVVLAGGAIFADDGHQHVSGPINVLSGGSFGSTYDGGASGTTGNKGMFVDGVVSGSGPLALEQAMSSGAIDRYGNGQGNPYNSSVVTFSNNANTYSGTITVVPYNAGGGSYLAVNGSLTLQFATVNLDCQQYRHLTTICRHSADLQHRPGFGHVGRPNRQRQYHSERLQRIYLCSTVRRHRLERGK